MTFRRRSKGAGKLSKRTLTGRQGANALRISRKLLKGRPRIRIVAIDAAGNRSKPAVVKLRKGSR